MELSEWNKCDMTMMDIWSHFNKDKHISFLLWLLSMNLMQSRNKILFIKGNNHHNKEINSEISLFIRADVEKLSCLDATRRSRTSVVTTTN